ncbi:MAG: arsenosugar biosynthesis radical SAM (seleno)protein ArsS [Limisphaerales bacterium]
MNRFEHALRRHDRTLRRSRTDILQINVGKVCNLTCLHCHVNAGPARKEIMSRETMGRIIDWLARTDIPIVDITGGAPEMMPDFRHLVKRLKSLDQPRHIIDRCNLTILLEPAFTDLPQFLAAHEIEIIASLPCYSMNNVDAQRGDGVFDRSIRALQILNELGYGIDPRLPLHLVYNPVGAFLPAPQAELEADYQTELRKNFGIVFNRLYTITNMPIARFAAFLRRSGQFDDYLKLLADSFNPATVEGLMCRNTLNVGWRGEVYDCDFNQMLDLQWRNGRPLFLWDIDLAELENRTIQTGNHCFGCTAGCGSSCTGSLAEQQAMETTPG